MFDYTAHGLIESVVKKALPGDGPQTVGTILDRSLSRGPNRTALVGPSGRYSYAELERQVAQAAAVFYELGVRQYDRVAACLPNDVDIVIALLGCARVGAIWVGVNRALAIPEKVFILEDSGARIYLTDSAGCEGIEPQQKNLSTLEHIITVDSASSDKDWHSLLRTASSRQCKLPVLDSFEPAAIAYTSGTTGRPKGAVHSHHNMLLPGAIEVHKRSYGPDCPQGVMLPLTILNLMVLAPMVAFQDGSCCVCMDSLKPEDIARWVREERVGHFASVPTVIQDLLTSPLVAPTDLATLGCPDIGGAGISEAFQRLYQDRFGQSMTVAYGMTEAPTIVTRTDPGSAPLEELCGRAVDQIRVQVVDESDRPIPACDVGEICVMPATTGVYANVYTIMLGYWNKPEASAVALSKGMYHTGDVGYLDERGQLFIRGRQNDLIIRGGSNVYPAEVERVICSHPSVADAAVLGIQDDRLGQRVVAVLEHSDMSGTIDEVSLITEIQSYCREKIARYKVPQQIVFIEKLPRNAMNKIIKLQLVNLFE